MEGRFNLDNKSYAIFSALAKDPNVKVVHQDDGSLKLCIPSVEREEDDFYSRMRRQSGRTLFSYLEEIPDVKVIHQKEDDSFKVYCSWPKFLLGPLLKK
jgi:hypothetical protein